MGKTDSTAGEACCGRARLGPFIHRGKALVSTSCGVEVFLAWTPTHFFATTFLLVIDLLLLLCVARVLCSKSAPNVKKQCSCLHEWKIRRPRLFILFELFMKVSWF